MKILVDADGCPVRKIIVKITKAEEIPLLIVSNIHHQIDEDYGQHLVVDAEFDEADHVILANTNQGDLVITQDYGLASLVLSKQAYALHQDGWFYTEENIDSLLMKRYLGQKIRKKTKRFSSIPKRTLEQDKQFEKALRAFIDEGSYSLKQK